MRERLYYDIESSQKKILVEALKNEQKWNKKIPVYDKNGEFFVNVLKWDVYSSYLDFWLDNDVSETITEKPGRIKDIEIYDFTTKKGITLKRVKKIVA